MSPHYRQVVRRLDKNCDPKSDAGKACALMMAALKHGTKRTGTLAHVTGVPFREACRIARRLRDNGIWRNGATYCDWASEDGGISFWCDVNVAIGYMRRSRPTPSHATVENK